MLIEGVEPPPAGLRGGSVGLLEVVEAPTKPGPWAADGVASGPRPGERAIASEPAAPAVAGWGDGTSLSDLVGGRGLAWLGGIATLLGVVLLLALAISHGWIGREVRVALAWTGSAALMLIGTWLHAHRGRTVAAVTMVGTATAGMFATLVVAGDVYHLIPPLLGVAGAMVVGAVATALAIRWAGIAIAIVGLLGALVSPAAVGAPLSDATTVALLAIAAACATWVVLWRRWPWLAFATVVVCAPQWALWMHYGHGTLANLAVLVTLGSLGLLGALVAQARSEKEDNPGSRSPTQAPEWCGCA